jgi:ABC-type lipoprotein export system ATPase subunit
MTENRLMIFRLRISAVTVTPAVGYIFQKFGIAEKFIVKENAAVSSDLQGKVIRNEEVKNALLSYAASLP